MHRPTIGLDFGSAYTKVAYRPPLPKQEKGKYTAQETDILSFGDLIAIPSVVIHTGEREKPWLCGHDAAGITPAKNWDVYKNWKSEIFSSSFRRKRDQLTRTASAFFGWLLGEINTTAAAVDSDTRVRFSVPAFGDIYDQKAFLRKCMTECGWPDDIEFVEEPVANAAGTFSGGRNDITAAGKMSYATMFGHHAMRDMNMIYDQARAYLVDKARTKRNISLTIVDCGGFTLDVAILDLDLKVTEHRNLPFTVVSSNSREIGVAKEIDETALDNLLVKHGVDMGAASFEALELAKYDLYAGNQHNLFVGSRIVRLGESAADIKIVRRAIDSYCEKVWGELSEACSADMEYVILTGGGSNIQHVKDFLSNRLGDIGISNVIHFPDNQSPNAARNNSMGILTISQYKQEFGRVATALGDASIAMN